MLAVPQPPEGVPQPPGYVPQPPGGVPQPPEKCSILRIFRISSAISLALGGEPDLLREDTPPARKGRGKDSGSVS